MASIVRGGQRYELVGHSLKKAKAQDTAKDLRKKGRRVRVVKHGKDTPTTSTVYGIYARNGGLMRAKAPTAKRRKAKAYNFFDFKI